MKRCADVAVGRLLVLAVGVITVMPGLATAQTREWTGNGFVSFSVGGQSGDGGFQTRLSQPVFLQTADYVIEHRATGGALVDVSGGVRVWRNLAVGIGVTATSSTDGAIGVGTVPHPLFFDRSRSVSFVETGVGHRRVGIHVAGVWVIPISERFRMSVFGGPSIIRLRQDLAIAATTGAELAPFTNVDVSLSVTSVSKAGVGGNIGFDGTYLLTDRLGIGGFFRYVGGSVDLPTGDGTASVDVGGAQAGGGVRLFF